MKSSKLIAFVFFLTFGISVKAQIYGTKPFFFTDSILSKNNLRTKDTVFVRNRLSHSYFDEDISSTIFLSKSSFFSNKRWITKADFPERKGLIIDARINPYINISSENWNFGKGKDAWMVSLYFNPDFEVRLFDDDNSVGDKSKPVRTASFRPGAEMFISKANIYDNVNAKYRYAFSFKANHHSNGQDGEVFNSTDKPWGKRGFVNTYNGDFSDDLLLSFNAMGFMNTLSNKHLFFLKLGYSISTGITEQLALNKLYGTDRANLMWSWTFKPNYRIVIGDSVRLNKSGYHVERCRVEFYLSYITNNMNVGSIYNLQKATFSDRINFHITGHYRIPGFTAAGLFTEVGYYGQDSYNIYLQQSSWFAKFGISFGLFKYDKKINMLLDN